MKRLTSYILILMLMTLNGYAQTSWEKYSGNPILSGGSQGEWDESGILVTGTLFDGTTYHMWYSTLESSEGVRSVASSSNLRFAFPSLAIE